MIVSAAARGSRFPLILGGLTAVGLIIILLLPLPGLVFIAGIGLPWLLRSAPKRLLQLLPFWTILGLPAAYGHPGRSLEITLRSLDSLILLTGTLVFLGESGLYRLFLCLPGPLGVVLLLSLKHVRSFSGALRRSAMAMRLRGPRHSLFLWGGVLASLFRKAERQGERVARAAQLRALPWSW